MSQEDKARHPRWDHNLYVVDRNGKMVESWEQHNALFVRPHRVLINPYDPEKHVWLVDDGAQKVYKFTNDGKKLVTSWGEFKVAGNDSTHFGRPTDIAWLPDGSFFVSDGYTNTRVVKFDKDGKYVLAWGEKGTPPNEKRPGYFNTVHAIAIDKNRRVYVADRANSRIQIFDENGKLIEDVAERPPPVLGPPRREPEFLGRRRHHPEVHRSSPPTASSSTPGAPSAPSPAGSGASTSSAWTARATSTPRTSTSAARRSSGPKKGANPAHLVGKYWPVAK